MAGGSFVSKYPPQLSNKPVVNSYYNANTRTYTDYGVQPTEVLRARWFSGGKTLGFKTYKRKDLPILPFQGGAVVYYDGGGSARNKLTRGDGSVDYHVWTGTARFMFPVMYNVLDGFWSKNSLPAKVNAEQKALSKVSNLKFNAAQALGERAQTANMLAKSVNRLVLFSKAVRKGNFARARLYLWGRDQLFTGRKWPKNTPKTPTQDEFGNLWLEVRYGWMPLVKDIYGAAELLAQQFEDIRPMYVVATAKAEEAIKQNLTEFGVSAEANGICRFTAKCGLGFDIADYDRDLVRQTGIDNPALLAWELLPYSFVVDWFLPVGNFLERLNATSGLRFVKGYTSVKTDAEAVSRHTGNSVVAYEGVGSFSVRGRAIILDRYSHSTFPGVVLPKFEWGLNVVRATSALALLNQVFARGRKTTVYR